MSAAGAPPGGLPETFAPIRRVAPAAPFTWLALGWRDLRRAPVASLAYGVAFALMGWLIHFVFRNAYEYVYGLAAGFLLVGPALAAGLYDISRRLERGEPVALAPTLAAWRANPGAFGVFAVILLVLLLVWSRASLVIFALFFSGGLPSLQDLLSQVLSAAHWDFVLTWFAAGSVFALLAFAAGAVSVPMMLDRRTDAVLAVLNSVRALIANPLPMALWAALIVLLVAGGFATLMFGLVVTGPLVGHATWHAYRALLGAPAAAP
jgi:uncharacterized membrane protein